jgi:hypothetical protein
MSSEVVITNIKETPHYSTVKHTGITRINGYTYLYNQKNDALIREDYATELRAMRKKGESFDDFLSYINTIDPEVYKIKVRLI